MSENRPDDDDKRSAERVLLSFASQPQAGRIEELR
jgi:hypothetical protein